MDYIKDSHTTKEFNRFNEKIINNIKSELNIGK